MKKLLLVILLFNITLNVNGQKHIKLKEGVYLGLNSTNLIKNVLSFNSTDLDDPYTLVGFKKSKKSIIRFGLGLDFESKKNDFQNFADNTHTKIDFRVGFQHSKVVWGNLHFIYGFDGLGGWESDITKRGEFFNNDLILSVGGGPIMGAIYKINDRVVLSTESSLYFKYSYKESKYKNGFGEDEEKETSNNYSVRHILPNSLYIYIRL